VKIYIKIEDKDKIEYFYDKLKEFAKKADEQFNKDKEKVEKMGVTVPEVLHTVSREGDVIILQNTMDLGLANFMLRRVIGRKIKKSIEEFLKSQKIKGKVIKVE